MQDYPTTDIKHTPLTSEMESSSGQTNLRAAVGRWLNSGELQQLIEAQNSAEVPSDPTKDHRLFTCYEDSGSFAGQKESEVKASRPTSQSTHELFKKHRTRDRKRKQLSIESVSAMACKELLKSGGVPPVTNNNPAQSSRGSQDKTFESLFYESFDGGNANGDGASKERILTIETLEQTHQQSSSGDLKLEGENAITLDQLKGDPDEFKNVPRAQNLASPGLAEFSNLHTISGDGSASN